MRKDVGQYLLIPKQLSSHRHDQATAACLTACLTTSKHRLHILILHPVYITNMRLARHTGSWQCHVGLASAQPGLLFPQGRDFSTQYWGRVDKEAEMAEGSRTTFTSKLLWTSTSAHAFFFIMTCTQFNRLYFSNLLNKRKQN